MAVSESITMSACSEKNIHRYRKSYDIGHLMIQKARLFRN
jgi:hypothetical protein